MRNLVEGEPCGLQHCQGHDRVADVELTGQGQFESALPRRGRDLEDGPVRSRMACILSTS